MHLASSGRRGLAAFPAQPLRERGHSRGPAREDAQLQGPERPHKQKDPNMVYSMVFILVEYITICYVVA